MTAEPDIETLAVGAIVEPSAELPSAEALAEATAASIPIDPADRRGHERRDVVRRRLLAAADVTAALVAIGAVAVLARPDAHAARALETTLAVIPIWLLTNEMRGLYGGDANRVRKSTLDEMPEILRSVSFLALGLFFVIPILSGVEIDRLMTAIFWGAATVTAVTLRSAARYAVRRTFRSERLVVLGSGAVAFLIARKIDAHPEWGVTLLGYIDDTPHTPSSVDVTDLPYLGRISDFDAASRRHEIDRVLVAFPSAGHEVQVDIIRASRRRGLKVSVVPRLFEVIGRGVDVDQIDGMTLLGLRFFKRSKTNLGVKRGIDICGAVLGLVLLAPVAMVVAVAVRTTSPGPVLFRQRRVGHKQGHFSMYKFRTMVDGADDMKCDLLHLNESQDARMFKISEDPRVTRVGRVLRRTSLDEIPQLINVLRGEMSLVGPRPLVPDEDGHVIGWHRERLELKPGLTGPWQVMGRHSIPFEEMVKMDYIYVAEWSLWTDLQLLLQTVPAVARRHGV